MSDAEPATTTAKQRELLGGLPSGTRIRAYEIISILGQGSFGITYLARDTTLNREVAIKEYLPTLLALRDGVTMVMPRSTEQAEDFVLGRERFLAEARTLATLGRAPAVVGIYDFLEANGTAYIVMELARGETLAQHIKLNGQLSPRAIELLVYPLLDGLEQVHGVGYLHRDIKPSNIILDAAGSPTLIDFGAAREAIAGRTTSVTAIFTPGYAAAEQFASAKLGPWTDIYSLSATLYQAITGIQSPSAFERTLDDAYKPLVRLAPAGFSYGLLNGIDAGMQVRAADRPQSIAGWRKLIEQSEAPDDDTVKVRKRRAVVSVPAPAADVAAPPAAIRTAFFYKRRRKLIWSSVAATAILLAGGGYFSKSLFSSTAVQALTTEELAQALEERRKADAAAAEKKKLEEEAQRQAAIDAEAKRKADEALVLAQQQRQKAEEELARLKTEMEARRKSEEADRQQAAAAAQKALDEASKQKRAEAEMAALRRADEKARTEAAADALAKQQADEAAQRKAEAETTARRLVEEEARKKAVAEAEAKRQADEALAKAQADRQRADELAAKQTAELEARQKADAEAKAKAEADVQAKAEAASKAKAEADAKAKTEAEVAAKAKAGAEAIAKAEADAMAVKKAAETVETALKLSVIDRQHLQVALTALGFDTKGSDGVFGPRTRDMIAAWQKVRNQPPTGFLNAAHQQALTKEAAPAIDKYDAEQKKIEEEKKKAEEEAKKKAEDEAKKKNDEEAKIKADEEAKARASDDARKKAQESARSLTLQWNVRLEADSFAPSGCVGGTAGILRIKDGVLTWTQDAKPNTPRWTVTLGPDGSADQIVPIPSEGFGVHVTIPAGSGPRIVHSTALGGRRCSFRYLPN